MFTQVHHIRSSERGFTLLELLIVIAIIAILATILIIVINPVETLRKARDVQRLADLSTLKTAIGLYLTVEPSPAIGTCITNPGDTFGSGDSVYYSIAGSVDDEDVAGGSDNVVTVSNPSLTDGNGWIPIDFTTLSGGSPISNLPLDPVNTVSSDIVFEDLVYRYACAESPFTFEINARLESDTFSNVDNKHTTDGGNNSELYEVGTNLQILPDETGDEF